MTTSAGRNLEMVNARLSAIQERLAQLLGDNELVTECDRALRDLRAAHAEIVEGEDIERVKTRMILSEDEFVLIVKEDSAPVRIKAGQVLRVSKINLEYGAVGLKLERMTHDQFLGGA